MKKLAFLGVILLVFAIGRPSHAGDTWAGFYVGANAGYAWGNANSTLGIADGPVPNCHFCALNPAPTGNDASIAQNAGSTSFNPNGFIGGLQLGYNWQPSDWVYGLEFDYQAFSQSQTENNSVGLPANSAIVGNCTSGITTVPCVGNFSTSVKASWLITLRPRIGYTWDHTLVYATGGLAVTKLSYSQSYTDNLNFLTSIGGSESASASQTKFGWVIGGGLEQALGNNWSVKAEYLYVRFNDLSAGGTLTDSGPGVMANFTNSVDHFSANIGRIGINYKFGG